MQMLLRWPLLALAAARVAAQTRVSVTLRATTAGEIASDKAAFYYPSSNTSDVLVVGNDGAATGGISVWTVTGTDAVLPEPIFHKTGRTKLVGVLYGLADKDWIVTLAQSDSFLRFFDVDTQNELEEARFKVWGDYSALCGWRSADSGMQYIYIFGKKQVKVYMVHEKDNGLKVLEVSLPVVETCVAVLILQQIQTIAVPIEAEGCAVSSTLQSILYGGDDGNVYTFPAHESIANPKSRVILSGKAQIAGLALYFGVEEEYLFVLYEESITVFNGIFQPVRNIKLDGVEDYALNDIAIYQRVIGTTFAEGALAFAIESDDVTGFALAPLESVVNGLSVNLAFSPRDVTKTNGSLPTCEELSNCHGSGYCVTTQDAPACDCFAGFKGGMCGALSCANNCNQHGTCAGPNICECEEGWSGPTCAFKVAYPKFETEENGKDGDDPAIWISPVSRNLSRIITTIKSKEGAGFAVFDLEGKRLQQFAAGEPNNVDILYGFPLGDHITDLVYAACREDNTLCFAELTNNGTLVDVPGSGQATPNGYTVYGSCTYHSPITDKFFVFVNAKDATYLQYEVSSSKNGTLNTTLVRSFRGGTGGQVEGCVTDEPNGWLLLGEEPYGLWRYSAEPPADHKAGEPDENAVGYLIDSVEGNLYADVEGVTLVYGSSNTTGFILVSCQGMSAYNVYRRFPPHEFVGQFTIQTTPDGRIDRVTNTDGIAAVGTALNEDFPRGLVVTHDDVNEAADQTVSEEAAFKLISLADVLDAALLIEIDTNWDPRAGQKPQ
ncbi:hypothetical protein BKA62DRAFT_766877 [Auriculariales sp. MPI-PUGE-AT-0066]|nr:hypothetical protein BKA62DRAFT_766877 [Auriculariales sp. MPI-PUGE-AT-0066]